MDPNGQLRVVREVAHRGAIAAAPGPRGDTPSSVSRQRSDPGRATGGAKIEQADREVPVAADGRERVRHGAELVDGRAR